MEEGSKKKPRQTKPTFSGADRLGNTKHNNYGLDVFQVYGTCNYWGAIGEGCYWRRCRGPVSS